MKTAATIVGIILGGLVLLFIVEGFIWGFGGNVPAYMAFVGAVYAFVLGLSAFVYATHKFGDGGYF